MVDSWWVCQTVCYAMTRMTLNYSSLSSVKLSWTPFLTCRLASYCMLINELFGLFLKICLHSFVCLYITGTIGGGSFCEERGEPDLRSGRAVGTYITLTTRSKTRSAPHFGNFVGEEKRKSAFTPIVCMRQDCIQNQKYDVVTKAV